MALKIVILWPCDAEVEIDKVCGVDNAGTVGLARLNIKDRWLEEALFLGPEVTAPSVHKDGLGVEDPAEGLGEEARGLPGGS